MLGNKYLKNAMVNLTKEGSDQYHVAANELDKLCQVTEMRWDMIAGHVFDKARKISFGQGALIGAAVVGGAVAVKEIVSRHKKNTEK